MDLGAENELVFKDLARAWAQEPKVQSEDQILENLLAGYWLGEFEELLIDRPEHWPDRRVTYSALFGCEGLPA